MLRNLLLYSALVCWPCYSYSESIQPYFGATGNAAGNGLVWSMDDVLPSPPGLDIQNVIYSYRIQKDTGEWVTVHVQNKLNGSNGYIFRETDEWKPGSEGGQKINKVVPVGNLHRSLWGEGSIDVEGNGSITEPNVIYTYKVTPCYDPQFDPNCPGYEPPKVEVPEGPGLSDIYDVTDDDNVDLKNKEWSEIEELTEEEDLDETDEEKRKAQEAEEEQRREIRLEQALAAASNALLFAEAFEQTQRIDQLNRAMNLQTYQKKSIAGGVYNDTIVLPDSQLPENPQGLRNGLAQQLLHEKMIEEQYK